MTTPRQRQLPFDEKYQRARESRAERIERLLSAAPTKLTTGAKMFDYQEATARAAGPLLRKDGLVLQEETTDRVF